MTTVVQQKENASLGNGFAARLADAWKRLVHQEPVSHIYQSPALFEACDSRTRPIVVPLSTCLDDEMPCSLAIFAPKNLRLKPVPGPKQLSFLFNGLRLVGDRAVGDSGPAAMGRLADACAELLESDCQRFVYFEVVHCEGELHSLLLSINLQRWDIHAIPLSPHQRHWWIDLPSSPDGYWKKFSSKSRYNLRRLQKGFTTDLRCFRGEEEVERMLTFAAAVSQNSWQDRRIGTRIHTSSESIEQWRCLARLGGLRSYVLFHDERPIAFSLGLQWHGRYYFEETGFDSEFVEASPGRILFCRMMDDLLEHDTPKLFDFGYGDGEYKEFFGTRFTYSQPWILIRNKVVPRALLTAHRASEAAVGMLRKWARSQRWLSGLRAAYRTLPVRSAAKP